MKKIALIINLIFLSIITNAQFEGIVDCGGVTMQGKYSKVISESGLNLRKTPSLKSDIISVIPNQAKVYSCDICKSCDTLIIEGIKGTWKKTFYLNKIGYVFDGFLQSEDIEFYFPQDYMCQSEKQIFKEDETYFGINNGNKKNGVPILEIDIYEGIEYLLNSGYLGEYKKIRVDDNTPSLIIKGMPLKEKSTIEGEITNRMLYPGEGISFGDYGNFYLYAKGDIEINNNQFYPIQKIKNYELILRQRTDDNNWNEQVLYQGEWGAWKGGMLDGGIFIKMIAELDKDSYPDIILMISEGCSWENILFLSTKKLENQIIGEVARYKSGGC